MNRCEARTVLYDIQCGNSSLPGTELCWMHTPGYRTPLQKAQAENEKLKKFAREFISVECWGHQPKIEGETIQEVAEQCGLLEEHPATKEDCVTYAEYEVEVGDPIYKFTDVLRE